MHLILVWASLLSSLSEASRLSTVLFNDGLEAPSQQQQPSKPFQGKLPIEQLSYDNIQTNFEGHFYFPSQYLSKQKRDLGAHVSPTISSVSVTLRPRSCIDQNVTSWTKNFRINITPTIKDVQASTVLINLDTEATPKFHAGRHLRDPIPLKLVFRAFGSHVEEERIFVLRGERKNEEELPSRDVHRFSDDYSIDNLHPDTGYIFCLFLLTQNNSIQSKRDEFERNENDTSSVGSSSSENKSTQLLDGNGKSSLSSSSASTSIPQRQTPSRRRNYAYTSTGKLIYLPSSSWTPHSRSRRSDKQNELKKCCLEIKTLVERSEILSPLFVLTILSGFIGGTVVVLITIFIWRNSWLKTKSVSLCMKKKLKGKEEKNDSKRTEGLSDLKESDNFENSTDAETTNKREKCNGRCSKVHQLERHSSSTKLHLKCKASYIKDNKLEALRNSNGSKFDSDISFHPGYELPPSSTVEAYGYDYPKPRNNRGVENLLSPTPSSCELNDHLSDSMWDSISSKVNLDIPHNCNKHSEVIKCINTFGDASQSSDYDTLRHEVFSSPSRVDKAQHAEDLCTKCKPLSHETCPHINAKDMNYNICLYKTQPPKLEAVDGQMLEEEQQQNVRCRNVDNEISREIQSYPSLGDVTITGGTLIEVPEGYVVPKASPTPVSSSVIRIKIDGSEIITK